MGFKRKSGWLDAIAEKLRKVRKTGGKNSEYGRICK
jgi:hypothetical protein